MKPDNVTQIMLPTAGNIVWTGIKVWVICWIIRFIWFIFFTSIALFALYKMSEIHPRVEQRRLEQEKKEAKLAAENWQRHESERIKKNQWLINRVLSN